MVHLQRNHIYTYFITATQSDTGFLHLLVSQFFPLNPAGHLHWYVFPSALFEQTAPCWHGPLSHGLRHFSPVLNWTLSRSANVSITASSSQLAVAAVTQSRAFFARLNKHTIQHQGTLKVFILKHPLLNKNQYFNFLTNR